MNKFPLPTLVLTLSLGLVGCGNGDDDASGDGASGGGNAAAIEPADTAQGTLDALGRAVKDGDADAIDGLIVGGGDIETAMESIMKTEAKTERFKTKVREAYGEEGMQKLENATGALREVTSDPFDPGKYTLTVEGDTATASKGEGDNADKMKLVKRDGRWYIDAKASAPPQLVALAGPITTVSQKVEAALDTAIDKVGDEGTTLDQIMADLSQKVQQAMQEMTGAFTSPPVGGDGGDGGE